MKTFAQLMEQIPGTNQTPVDVARARANEISKRQQRRHVHNELEHTAYQENKRKQSDIG
jgi:hypothetical protein